MQLYQKETLTQAFSCEYCKSFTSTYFEKQLRTVLFYPFSFWFYMLTYWRPIFSSYRNQWIDLFSRLAGIKCLTLLKVKVCWTHSSYHFCGLRNYRKQISSVVVGRNSFFHFCRKDLFLKFYVFYGCLKGDMIWLSLNYFRDHL